MTICGPEFQRTSVIAYSCFCLSFKCFFIMRRTLLCWHHCFKFNGNDRLRNRDSGIGTCCWTLVTVKLCWFRYWYTMIIYVSIVLSNVVSFFYKDEGKRRFVIAFKIVIGLCYFSPLPWTQLKWVLSLCFFDNFRPQIVHFSTIDSFRLFLHRVSSNHYFYHHPNMDTMYPSSRGREPVGEVKIKLYASLASQRIHFTSQWQVLKDSRDHARDQRQRRLYWRSSLNVLSIG